MLLASLRLFNAIQVESAEKLNFSEETLTKSVSKGYILDPNIVADSKTLETIETLVGISGEKANAAFHKSWLTITQSSDEKLVTQQMVHYLTTYGFKSIGVFDKNTVYIPKEILDLPNIDRSIPLTTICAISSSDLLQKIILLGRSVALSKETLDDIMSIVNHNEYDAAFISQISNRELRSLLNHRYKILPTEPVEFLRYVVTKLTTETLLIKNQYLIDKIKLADGYLLDQLMAQSPSDLGSIFLRYKPLFLAMKTISYDKGFYNRLRKKAVKLHKPLAVDYLNNVTNQIKQGDLDLNAFQARLKSASIFRKIRLAYALNSRLVKKESIVYHIRNGRGWATDFVWPTHLNSVTQDCYDRVIQSIVKSLKSKVKDKCIYIPQNIHYTMPATEKQFIGNLPIGSYVTVPDDLIVGIHWTNTDRSIDLDLSVIGASGKIGWDTCYSSKSKDVIFSGDITDAPKPKGATELFYVKKSTSEPVILSVNYYNFNANDPVGFKLIVANETPKNFSKNYMIDISNMVATANLTLSNKQSILGLVCYIDGKNRVYLSNISVGNTISAVQNTHCNQARDYLVSSTLNSIELKSVLVMAGANIVNEIPDGDFIDLSPQNLQKSTIIDLFVE